MNIRCGLGWHNWRYVKTVFDINDHYDQRPFREMVEGARVRRGEIVVAAHRVACRKCARQSTVIHTNHSPIVQWSDERHQYGVSLLAGDDGAAVCETYVMDRHEAGQLGTCGHLRRHHGIWDEFGDRYIEGACRDCHCEEFS